MPSSSCAVPVLPAMLTGVPAMTWRAVPSSTTRRIAPARNCACPAGNTSTGASARGLLSSAIQRPSGILPPAAMAAATRAILKGDTSTGALPVRGKRQLPAQFAGSPVAMPNCAAVSASACDPTSCTPNCAKYALHETAMALFHVERAVRAVADIVFNGAVPARDGIARAPVGQRAAQVTCGASIPGSRRRAAMAVTSLNVEPGGYSP